eukprot:1784971-Rhodomonas_salina.1
MGEKIPAQKVRQRQSQQRPSYPHPPIPTPRPFQLIGLNYNVNELRARSVWWHHAAYFRLNRLSCVTELSTGSVVARRGL